MPDEFTYDVFVSYSSKDKQSVEVLARKLVTAGFRVWLDDWVIEAGAPILATVEKGLQSSRVLLLCISANSTASDWAELESSTIRFQDPMNRQRRLVPVTLDGTLPEGSLAGFRAISWNHNSPDADLERLIAACRGDPYETGPRRRIGMLCSEYPPHVLGGLGVHVTRLTKELGLLADLHLILPHRKPNYDDPPQGVSIRPLASVSANYDEPLSWLRFAQHAYDVIERMRPRPQIMHCHDWVSVLAGIRCRWTLGIPLIFHVHLPNRTPFCASIENLGLLCADIVTVNSQAMAEQLRERFPLKRMVVIPNGVDMETFKPATTRDDKPFVFFAGRLVEQKGVDYLLRAFVHVARRFPDLQLKLAGAGPAEHAYKRMAESLLISDRVAFLGWKSPLELSRLYQDATVVAVPSLYEPFGMTALEAMACGTAVVASDTGGLREIVRDRENGILVEPGDHLDLAQWLIRLLDDSELRNELGSKATRDIHPDGQYSWSRIAYHYLEIYNALANTTVVVDELNHIGPYVEQIKTFAAQLDYEPRLELLGWLK